MKLPVKRYTGASSCAGSHIFARLTLRMIPDSVNPRFTRSTISVIWADTLLKSLLQISSQAETIKTQRWGLRLYWGAYL